MRYFRSSHCLPFPVHFYRAYHVWRVTLPPRCLEARSGSRFHLSKAASLRVVNEKVDPTQSKPWRLKFRKARLPWPVRPRCGSPPWKPAGACSGVCHVWRVPRRKDVLPWPASGIPLSPPSRQWQAFATKQSEPQQRTMAIEAAEGKRRHLARTINAASMRVRHVPAGQTPSSRSRTIKLGLPSTFGVPAVARTLSASFRLAAFKLAGAKSPGVAGCVDKALVAINLARTIKPGLFGLPATSYARLELGSLRQWASSIAFKRSPLRVGCAAQRGSR